MAVSKLKTYHGRLMAWERADPLERQVTTALADRRRRMWVCTVSTGELLPFTDDRNQVVRGGRTREDACSRAYTAAVARGIIKEERDD